MKKRLTLKQYQSYAALGNGKLEEILSAGTVTEERKVWESISEQLRLAILLDVKFQLRSGIKESISKFELSKESREIILSFRADERLEDGELSALYHCLSKLKKLNLRSRNLQSLEDIAPYLSSLEELSISDNHWKDFDSLSPLKEQLKTLYCINCGLSTLDSLPVFVNLEQLFCGLNTLTSLDGLLALNELSWINCRGNKIPKQHIKSFQTQRASVKVVWRNWFLF